MGTKMKGVLAVADSAPAGGCTGGGTGHGYGERFAARAVVHRPGVPEQAGARRWTRPPTRSLRASFIPAFFGCYDWHSSAHGHWMLVRAGAPAAGTPVPEGNPRGVSLPTSRRKRSRPKPVPRRKRATGLRAAVWLGLDCCASRRSSRPGTTPSEGVEREHAAVDEAIVAKLTGLPAEADAAHPHGGPPQYRVRARASAFDYARAAKEHGSAEARSAIAPATYYGGDRACPLATSPPARTSSPPASKKPTSCAACWRAGNSPNGWKLHARPRPPTNSSPPP